MDCTFEEYCINIGIRSLEYTYDVPTIMKHIDFFRDCHRRGLSAYKALLYLNAHIEYLAGRSTVTEWYNDYNRTNSYVSDDYYTMCYEGGVTIKPFKSCPWLNLYGMFNTNSIFKTLVVFTYTFKNL
jgi:hypothetical protein